MSQIPFRFSVEGSPLVMFVCKRTHTRTWAYILIDTHTDTYFIPMVMNAQTLALFYRQFCSVVYLNTPLTSDGAVNFNIV